VPVYDKRHFEPNVIKCKTNPEQYLLDDEVLAQFLAVFRSTDKKPALALKTISLSSIAETKEKATALLARVVTANKPIAQLKENPALESWVKEGRQLHENKTECQFCGQPLPADLLTHLTEHFSADYDNLMTEVSGLEAQLTTAQAEEIALDSKGDFYQELQTPFTAEKTKLDKAIKARKTALKILAKAVASKRAKAFSSLECPAIDDPTEEITSAIEAINKTISEHNSRTAEFDKNRGDAFTKLALRGSVCARPKI
jgi:wobble nucleotide-excising tRNase